MSNGYIANIRKGIGERYLLNIAQQFPQLNRTWLLFGEGDMLKPQPSVVQSNVNGDNNYIGGDNCGSIGGDIPTLEAEEVTGAPIIPTTLARAGSSDINIIQYIERNADRYERSTITIDDMPVEAWHRVRGDAMIPDYTPGDMLALCSFPDGHNSPRPGMKYAVQTKSNGLFSCVLFPEEEGYRAHFVNSSKFPDFFIEPDDLVSIYRILMMVRI